MPRKQCTKKAGGTQEARGSGGDALTLAAAEMGLTDAATDSEVFRRRRALPPCEPR